MEYPTTEEVLTDQQSDTSSQESQPSNDGTLVEGQASVEDSRQIQQRAATPGTPASQGARQQAGKQSSADDFVPDKWQLKYRDKVVVPKDRDHLINLAQQGFSYSQRMAELKQRETEIENNRQRYEQYEKLDKAFEANPQFRKQIFDWYNQSFSPEQKQQAEQQVQQQAGPAAAQIPQELLQEIASFRQFKEQFEQQQEQQASAAAEKEVQTEIEELKKKYPRDDWDTLSSNGMTLAQEIIKHALDNGSIKLETAYRDLMWDQHVKSIEAETLKKAAEQSKVAKRAGIVAGGKAKGVQAPAPVDYGKLDYRDIEKLVKEEYNIQ
jgi:hypothetical protein